MTLDSVEDARSAARAVLLLAPAPPGYSEEQLLSDTIVAKQKVLASVCVGNTFGSHIDPGGIPGLNEGRDDHHLTEGNDRCDDKNDDNPAQPGLLDGRKIPEGVFDFIDCCDNQGYMED